MKQNKICLLNPTMIAKKRDFFVMAIFLDIDLLFLKFRNCEHSVPRTSLRTKWTSIEQTLCGVWKLYTQKNYL